MLWILEGCCPLSHLAATHLASSCLGCHVRGLGCLIDIQPSALSRILFYLYSFDPQNNPERLEQVSAAPFYGRGTEVQAVEVLPSKLWSPPLAPAPGQPARLQTWAQRPLTALEAASGLKTLDCHPPPTPPPCTGALSRGLLSPFGCHMGPAGGQASEAPHL